MFTLHFPSVKTEVMVRQPLALKKQTPEICTMRFLMVIQKLLITGHSSACSWSYSGGFGLGLGLGLGLGQG